MRTQVMDDLKKLFAKNQVCTLRLLAEQLDYSEISVRRFLKRIGYVRSYTEQCEKLWIDFDYVTP